jgi:hypothetical protein
MVFSEIVIASGCGETIIRAGMGIASTCSALNKKAAAGAPQPEKTG